MNVEYLNLVTILSKYNSHIFIIEMEWNEIKLNEILKIILKVKK
jgi:hypothetical protein